MELTEQTTSDVRGMLETTNQRIHETNGTPEAINAHNPAEVAMLYDLRDYLRGMLPD